MAEIENAELITMTADIVSAYVSHNKVETADIGSLIATVHSSLASAGAPAEPEAPAKPAGAVSIRKSLADPSKIISMIDGKPYSSLKRHLTGHGYTPDSYRKAFSLPSNYPFVAEAYSAARREISLKLGLGRRKVGDAAAGIKDRGGKVVEAVVETVEEIVKPKRESKPKGIAAAKKAAQDHLGSSGDAGEA